MEKRIYKTKVGYEMVVLMAIILVPQIVLSICNPVSIYLVLALVGIALLVGFLSFKTVYVVEGYVLSLGSGFLYKQSINIKRVRKIVETRNPISSPAMSLDRLEVFYNKFDTVIISPKEKEAFVKHLQQINPGIEFIPRKK